jgi:hypothetical protein
MFAYVENGKLMKIQQTPSDPELGEDLSNASLPTLRNFGWLPVEIQHADVGDDQTRSDDIIIIDGDKVRIIQTVRDLTDAEAFRKIKDNIMSTINGLEKGQSDRAERELLLEISEHLGLTSSKAYEILKTIDDRISANRKLLKT